MIVTGRAGVNPNAITNLQRWRFGRADFRGNDCRQYPTIIRFHCPLCFARFGDGGPLAINVLT